MALRFNPPPGWPPPPEGFTPDPGWRPDPSWPAAPPGWQLWVADAPEREASSWLPPGYSGYGEASAPYSQAPAPYSQAPAPYSQAPAPYSQAPAPYSQAPAWGPPTPPPSGTSGMAIAAFALGLLGFAGVTAILGIVLGSVALGRIRRTFRPGRRLAIAGIALGGGWLALSAIIVIVVVSSSSSSSGPPGQTVAPYALKTGDCFDNPPGTDVSSVVRTRCTQPHSAQVFATFNVSGSQVSYPGDAKMQKLATSGCSARMGRVDNAKVPDSVNAGYLFPESGTWLDGVRTITCILYSPTQNLTSSLLKSPARTRSGPAQPVLA